MTKSEILQAHKTNTPVWWVEPWSGQIMSAKVQAIKQDHEVEYAELRGMNDASDLQISFVGTNTKSFEQLFSSREVLEKHLADEKASCIARIRSQIQTKDDMIRFMFNHPVACCEEYTDWNAREAVKQIACEKWNIKLE